MIGKKILVAPLDWGLGHATRCIPIINSLLAEGHQVLVAADGPIEILLKSEFPTLYFFPLRGYKIEYAKSKSRLALAIISQIPKIMRVIGSENAWLQNFVVEHQIDLIISDNRYGLYHKQVPSIFITHQLLIQAPILKRLLQSINYSFIHRFSACWIPDYADLRENLAGSLSHPKRMPQVPVHFIGPLSRFSLPDQVTNDILLILLSGPEPQRTLLEQLLLSELKDYKQPVVLVRGLPGDNQQLQLPEHIKVYNHLSAAELERYIAKAAYVIARCGYSTVMDLMTLRKKSILIPTPGQTEQEYLAKHLMKRQYACCIDQIAFSLQTALEKAASFAYQFPKPSPVRVNLPALPFR